VLLRASLAPGKFFLVRCSTLLTVQRVASMCATPESGHQKLEHLTKMAVRAVSSPQRLSQTLKRLSSTISTSLEQLSAAPSSGTSN
jgi:hypothetical protein